VLGFREIEIECLVSRFCAIPKINQFLMRFCSRLTDKLGLRINFELREIFEIFVAGFLCGNILEINAAGMGEVWKIYSLLFGIH
jgi:hypothetical protein